jgi:hypothetical protein
MRKQEILLPAEKYKTGAGTFRGPANAEELLDPHETIIGFPSFGASIIFVNGSLRKPVLVIEIWRTRYQIGWLVV